MNPLIREINVDFYDTKYVNVNAKQFDKASRFILVTCLNQGSFFFIDSSSYYVCIRLRKADNFGVFNPCTITDEGKILIELTEQMLACPGTCYADLVIWESADLITSDTGEYIIDSNTESINVFDSGVLSTMIFCIHVIANPIAEYEIESSYEFKALSELMSKFSASVLEYESMKQQISDLQERIELLESQDSTSTLDAAEDNKF